MHVIFMATRNWALSPIFEQKKRVIDSFDATVNSNKAMAVDSWSDFEFK